MKIYNQPIQNTSSNKPTFKAISPVAQKQLKVVVQSGASKELFAKIAGVAGLSAIITWVNSLKNSENKTESLQKLDVIDTAWSNKSSELILDPEVSEKYLDLVSDINDAESLLWTKALVSDTEKETYKPKEKASMESSKEMFLNPETNEIFMDSTANRVLNSINTQINAILTASAEQKEVVLSTIESKFNSLVKQAKELQYNSETSELYLKITNILKSFVFLNIIKNTSENKVEEANIVNLDKQNSIVNNTEIEDISEPKVDESRYEKIDLSLRDPVGEFKRNRFKEKQALINNTLEAAETNEPIIITDKNKDFVNNIFLPMFEDQAAVDPNIYSSYIDLIQKIYEGYSNESVKASFLNQLKFADKTKMLDLYLSIVDFETDKIQFVNFARIEQFKNANGGSLTKDEYELLNNYYANQVKYAELLINAPEKYVSKNYVRKPLIRINFIDNVPTKERLKIVSDFHKIVFNIPEQKLILGEDVEKIKREDVEKEIVKMLVTYFEAEKSERNYLPEHYNNILGFLRLEVGDLRDDYLKDGRSGLSLAISENFEQKDEYINEFMQLLNNEKFSGFISTTHARMRFIDRFVFSDDKWKNKELKGLKIATTRAINNLDFSLSKAPYLQFVNYCTDKHFVNEASKYGARILFLNDTVIAIDEKGLIHTMF